MSYHFRLCIIMSMFCIFCVNEIWIPTGLLQYRMPLRHSPPATQISNACEILHRGRQCRLLAFCRIVKWSDSKSQQYRQTRFREIWVSDEFRRDILGKLEQFHFMAVKYTCLSFYSLVPCYIPCLRGSQPIRKYIAYVMCFPIDCRYANWKETGLSLSIFRSNKNL